MTKRTVDLSLRIFLLTSIPYALFMGAWVGLLTGNVWHGVTSGIAMGLFCGMLMALGLGTVHHSATKRLNPDYIENLLAVHQVQVVTLQQPFEGAYVACLGALQELKQCRITQQDREQGTIRAVTGSTWKSFGEKILVTISPTGVNSCRVTISSKPAVNSTIVDYGKNMENIRSIVNTLGNQTLAISTRIA